MEAQWSAEMAQTALNLLNAAQERIESALKVAHPGDPLGRLRSAETAPVRLSITLDVSDLDRIGNDLHAFNAQVSKENP
ncbi:hypothetical protein SPW_0097 [Streptomyces sp. W007]|uniref:hypothetical protein n=1 Tax=Streptomyces sp. W007 TaxID=1055352 RepID=UPI0002419BFA|nr:hypothetical protein [Streptomyces sp. W007]EHM31517.1 hypothetical protein SPW_0097 [Streptomyces sp. W007]